jgi:cell division protein FtsI/penicillin-binding protein 2
MNYRSQQQKPVKTNRIDRVQILKVCLFIFGAIFISRLFYVQIIRHDFYSAQALAEHTKKYEIPAPRGLIMLQDGSKTSYIVLNEKRNLVYADPKYIADSSDAAKKITAILGGNESDLQKKLSSNSRYVILAKKIPVDQGSRLKDLKVKGVYFKDVSVRTYPQSTLAAQLLGFVNADGQGQYGLEGYLDSELSGKNGIQKAVTDVNGVPLAINNDNVAKQAQAGDDVTLTIDLGMQRLVEDKLKEGVDSTKAASGNAVLIDVTDGSIKAMANYPTYDPNSYEKVSDQRLFTNNVVTGAWEPGSVMKPLLIAAAFNENKISPDFSYFDQTYVQIQDRKITNALNYGAQTMTVFNILQKSLNTGAVTVLKQFGGGEITLQARQQWYSYLMEHYQFGKKTGIEQNGEAAGYVAKPDEGDAQDVRYANMAFGQGLTVTPLQIAAAYVPIANGGTYFKPHLVSTITKNGVSQPFAENKGTRVLSQSSADEVRVLIQKTLEANNRAAVRDGYILGAKSGSAQVAGNNGTYLENVTDGVYIGYMGGDVAKYVLLVRLDDPKTDQFASTSAARTWATISNGLIDNYSIQPKR